MSSTIYTKITGTGSYIPTERIGNKEFLRNEFFDNAGHKMAKANEDITDKFFEITTITERRYVSDELKTSDIAFYAAESAIKSANINKEELDYIIVAHNFGDVSHGSNRSDILPTLAARVKHKLKIINPETVAYDMTFGCPGWVQAVIQADYYIKSGDAKKILVIAADTLSRISDPHDIDSMLYADGAGAVILEAVESETPTGILAHKTRSDTILYSQMLYMGKSYNPNHSNPDDLFLKMTGRRLYQYALETVPPAIKACLDKSGTHIEDIKKVLIHQANGKMDDAILKRLYSLYDLPDSTADVMPMTISWLGNSSVATVPTLFDLIMKGELKPHKINKGDIVVFTSVGAGMNINAIVYKA
jgi:3-oxoacyl-[acyl-carrier-protein] synthase-3